ncbi:TetR/AcrR family transcriptional regulator [Solimonas soli]|uniref:TetR/AcrR family transcriptional regulator n=1 Tax=Solimonas soli TaxID=413479 RepID=UPI0004BC77CB|nr:TetR/AcrR family transcriptional regulator [Solimonas soli]
MDGSIDTGSTAGRILDAAEQLFALRGYHGVSIREVAALSGTELSLTRYHFGSKDELFRRVVARRAETVTQATFRSLTAALARQQGKPLSVEAIVRAFVTPIVSFPRKDEGWRNYLKLMIHSDSLSQRPELLKPLRDAYEPVFARYLEELLRAGYDRERACWLMYFIHWMINHVVFEVYELEKLSGGMCSSFDYETRVERMVSFIVGGAEAMREGAGIATPLRPAGAAAATRPRGKRSRRTG